MSFKFTYTTGPFYLPHNTHTLDWGVLNNDSTPQKIVVTVFKCPTTSAKTPEPPGPLALTLDPAHSTHNGNAAVPGFFYEIQVQCNSQLIFPYVSAWPSNIADPLAGSVINAAEFIRMLP